MCKPVFENAYEGTLEFVEKSKGALDTEITAVAIPEVDIKRVEEKARKMGVRFRRREYHPPFW